jgi:hypothetical protein
MAGADVLRFRLPDYIYPLGAKTWRGIVAFLPLRIVAEYLHQLRVVNGYNKGVRDGFQVHRVAVRGQLDSIRKSTRNILEEVRAHPASRRRTHLRLPGSGSSAEMPLSPRPRRAKLS